MPRTLRTYFDPNNHNVRKGKQNEINFLGKVPGNEMEKMGEKNKKK